MIEKYDNKGNQFFIEVIPDIDDEGEWLGRYNLAINVRRTNINDDSFFCTRKYMSNGLCSIKFNGRRYKVT